MSFSRIVATAATASICLVLYLTLRPPTQVAHLQTAPAEQWSMGFWTGWSPEPNISDLVWDALTHVVHVGVEPQTNGTLKLSDPNFDDHATELIAAAHEHNVKVLLNVWSGASADFNGAVNNSLDRLVESIAELVERYNYDGVDLDWEKGLNQNAMTLLLSHLRSRLQTRILTADVVSNDYKYWGSVHQYLDRVSVMTYDMGGTWNHYSWSNSALYSDPCNCVWSVELARVRMTGAGVPASKLNIGIPFFGWVSTGGGITGPRQPWGLVLPSLSQVTYKNLSARYNLSNPLWDHAAQVPYLSLSNGWVTFDNEQSIVAKVNYAKYYNLGGWIIWAVDQDYMPDQPVKHPLLTAVRDIMKAWSPDPE
jgi:chitinase